jgi:signal transduction histidine kinase
VRWFGVVFGLLSLPIQPKYPNSGTELQAWLLVALLAAGSFAIWGASARALTEVGHAKLSVVAFAFDALVIAGLVWIFAYEDNYVTWALLFLLPMEGALRYRMRGAALSVLGIALFFVVQSQHHADLVGSEFDLVTYVFVVGVAGLVAGVTGAMANQWYTQNQAFEQQSLKLAEVDELKDRFLAITSHEIRGPLTAIIAGVDTVRKKGPRLSPEQQDRLLEMVYLQGHQLARIVDDLQVTSQIQSGQLALHPATADLHKTIEQALEAAASKRRQHQLELFIEPLECEMDAPRIGQIVRNLVENAYKYTPDRTRVSVEAKATTGGIRITVSDVGKGIPADKRDVLFEAFSRIHDTSAGQEGVGLGLYVVSQLVSAMGGQIDLASSSRGTTFHIDVPCKTRSGEATPRLKIIEGETAG